MKHKVDLNRRLVASFAAIAMSLSLAAPAAFPAFASAASTIQSRSITMSSSVANATGVSYDLDFIPNTDISVGGGLVIDFCDDTPIVGLTCETNAGEVPDASGATLGAVNYDGSAASNPGSITKTATNLKWTAGAAFTADSVKHINIVFNNIANPTSNLTFYARVTTYASAIDYVAPNNLGTVADQGGLALATANNVGITAYVQESLYFCVSGSAPTTGCTGTSDPSMNIGETQAGGSVKVLDATKLSTGTDYAQIGTNASHGAVVNLQSDATSCGGLVRPNDGANCDIGPAAKTLAAAMPNTGTFGLILGPAVAATGGTASGALNASTGYDSTHYFMDFVSGDASGVTSTYGSPLFDTNSQPVSDMNMPITFGVSPQTLTPAGKYAVNLSLIATGTF